MQQGFKNVWHGQCGGLNENVSTRLKVEHLVSSWYGECVEGPYVSLPTFPYLIHLPFALILNHFPLPLP